MHTWALIMKMAAFARFARTLELSYFQTILHLPNFLGHKNNSEQNMQEIGLVKASEKVCVKE